MVMICEYRSAFAGAGFGGGEADRASRLLVVTRDLARLDDCGRAGAGPSASSTLAASAAPAARLSERPTSALVGLQQLPACTGRAQANTGEQDQRCRLENSLPGRANTRFNDSQPFRNCPSSGCKALVVKRGRSGRPVYSRSIPRPKSDNLSAGSLLRRSTARPEWQEVRWRLFWKIVCWDGDHANEPRLASRWRAAPGRIADSRRRRQ